MTGDPGERGLQAERTTMAWVRTAVSLEVTAVLAARAVHHGHGVLLFLAITTVGIAAFILSLLPSLHRNRTNAMSGGIIVVRAPVVMVVLVVAVCATTPVLIVGDRFPAP